jgi:thioredoxin 1
LKFILLFVLTDFSQVFQLTLISGGNTLTLTRRRIFIVGFFKSLFNRPPPPGKPRPITDESFEQEVLAPGVPAVVSFLDEIGPDYVGRVNLFRLNVLQNPTTAALYQVQGTPTLILFREGRAVDRIVGLMPLNPLRQKMEELAR